MTIVIDLTPEQETRLRQKAARDGQDAESVARTMLMQVLEDEAQANPVADVLADTSGAAALAAWEAEGAFLPREDLPDSPTLARQLREQSQNRTQAGQSL